MSNAASQAAAFYRDVAKSGQVWTIRDEGGYPAPLTRSGEQAHPFWSTRSRVERIIKSVPAYSGFEPEEIRWEVFRDKWLPNLRRDGYLLGVNWSGASAGGYDLDADWVQHCVEVEIENLGGPPATPLEQVAASRGGVMYRLADTTADSTDDAGYATWSRNVATDVVHGGSVAGWLLIMSTIAVAAIALALVRTLIRHYLAANPGDPEPVGAFLYIALIPPIAFVFFRLVAPVFYRLHQRLHSGSAS